MPRPAPRWASQECNNPVLCWSKARTFQKRPSFAVRTHHTREMDLVAKALPGLAVSAFRFDPGGSVGLSVDQPFDAVKVGYGCISTSPMRAPATF